MKIKEIKNIVRKDVPIYYRRLYSGLVCLDIVNKAVELAVDFQLEHKPTGQVEISLISVGQIDYPLVPLHKELKRFIGELDQEGKLPSTM